MKASSNQGDASKGVITLRGGDVFPLFRPFKAVRFHPHLHEFGVERRRRKWREILNSNDARHLLKVIFAQLSVLKLFDI